MRFFLADSDPLEHVVAHPIFGHHLTWFTNQSLMALLAGVIMLLIFPRLFRRPETAAPTGAKNFFESILEYLRIEVFRPALKEHTDIFVPFLWTVFFFIAFCNLLGCMPFVEVFGIISYVITGGHGFGADHYIPHLGGTATGSISTTATLAIIAFFFIHFHGINTVARDLMNGTYGHHPHHEDHTASGEPGHETAHDLEHMRGEALPADVPGNLHALGHPTQHYRDDEYMGAHGKNRNTERGPDRHLMSPGLAILCAIPLYIWNFAPHPFKPGPGESKYKWFMDVPFFLFLLFIEAIGAVIKPFALCMRLFANMVAGHVVLAVLIGLVVAIPSIGLRFAIGVPIAFVHIAVQLLEIFVAILQAYIFTFLVTLFIASAVAPEH